MGKHNWDEIDENEESRPIIPAGEEPLFEVTGATDKISQTSGNDMIELYAVVIEGEYAGMGLYDYIVYDTNEPDEKKGKKIQGLAKHKLKGLGVPLIGYDNPRAEAVHGKRAYITVAEDEYKGKPKNIVANYGRGYRAYDVVEPAEAPAPATTNDEDVPF